ncbi:dihydroorotate dehydrogenase [Fertoebacter nigrum]|uniref:Dihydroorotate dehydrogenase n=1 Tax=Fertoeibacter niger TaxID=2656921 RepID=A0A8X8KQJ9_9RHOB|nr:dihydroorotate dehydrogenase [Fertoeibacter niger]NUB46305.1 dihydroorotate dehydrogenase [Fertoeibacter niger]
MMRDSDLDDLFADLRVVRAEAPASLLMRVLEDAELHQPQPVALRAAPAPRRLWSLLAGGGLGGGGVLAGLATATLAGFWIGFAQPLPVTTLTAALWQQETLADDEGLDLVELIPTLDTYLPEG